jgi:putative membrane protein
MAISADDQKRIADAIHAAERQTSGEIVCVLARRSSDYTAIAVIWAALIALAAPWPMIALTQMAVDRIFAAQIAIFFVLLLVGLSLPALRLRLVPPPVARAHAHVAAMEQFMIRGLGRKKNAAAVLIFVSLAERYVRIIADERIAEVPQSEWQAAVDALIPHMRDRRIADGFVVAIERCGAVLAQHFPPRPDDEDELPDRIYLI